MPRIIDTATGPRRLGWRPPVPKPEHALMTAFRAPSGWVGPEKVDNRGRMLPMVNQGAIGDCTGQSVREAMEFLQHPKPGEARVKFSALFAYDMARMREGTPLEEDPGASIADAWMAARDVGVATEAAWSSDNPEVRMVIPPDEPAMEDAAKHRVTLGYSIPGWEETLASIAQRCIVNLGISLPAYVDSPEFASLGVLRYVRAGEQIVGGHSVNALGYNAHKVIDGQAGAILVSFHWGQGIGTEGGYVWVGRKYYDNAMVQDAHSPRAAMV